MPSPTSPPDSGVPSQGGLPGLRGLNSAAHVPTACPVRPPHRFNESEDFCLKPAESLAWNGAVGSICGVDDYVLPQGSALLPLTNLEVLGWWVRLRCGFCSGVPLRPHGQDALAFSTALEGAPDNCAEALV